MPALDGLRGVAVLLVFVGHLVLGGWPKWRPYGDWSIDAISRAMASTGVTLFFALSGYLITSILLAELERTGALSLRHFWLRRARRLYPALTATCLAFIGLSFATYELAPARALGEVVQAMTYTTNLFMHDSIGWLRFTWSLSVEEQFYALWPLLALLGYRIGGKVGVGSVAVACALVAALVRHAGTWDALTLYTVLRWDAPLMGCAVAAFGLRLRWLLAPATAALIYYSGTKAAYSPAAFTVTSCAAAVLVANAWRIRALDAPLLRYLGARSYGLYLWSCLILQMGLPWWVCGVCSLVAAELSWRYVEAPWLTAQARPGAAGRAASPSPAGPP